MPWERPISQKTEKMRCWSYNFQISLFDQTNREVKELCLMDMLLGDICNILFTGATIVISQVQGRW